MNDEFISLKELQVFYFLKGYLEKVKVESEILVASEKNPVNTLVAEINKQVSVYIMYIPLPEDYFTEIRLLQLYSPIVEEMAKDKKNDLLILLNELNNQSPQGNFYFNEKNQIVFKHIYPVSSFDMIPEVIFLEMFSLYMNCLTGFRNSVIHVNSGNLSLTDALKDVMAS